MSRINFVIVHQNEEPVLIHKIIRPDPTEKGFYVQSLSMDGFKNKYRFDKLNNFEYFVLTEKEFEYHSKKDYNNITVKEHLSVWNFYISINWDYKKKKFGDVKIDKT